MIAVRKNKYKNAKRLLGGNGFTLVELLISMTILSMIMLLGSWSFSLFTSKWEGRLGYFSQSVSQAKDLILLSDITSGIVPFVYLNRKLPQYYFSVARHTFKGITQNSIFHPDSTVAFQLIIEANPDGTEQLLYQESELGRVDLSASEVRYTHEKILIQNASNIRFRVKGWDSLRQKMASSDALSASSTSAYWRDSYNAGISNVMPDAISILWGDAEILVPLVNDHGNKLTLISQVEE